MLQFIAQYNEKYSIAEQAQMAIEGGCKWVILRVPEMSDSEIRELAAEVVPLCKETSTILTIENHVEMAKELALHGVHLRDCPKPAMAVREELGPEAIIGAEVGMASTAMELVAADVDYVAFPEGMSLEKISENVGALRSADFLLPIVAQGRFTAADIPAVLQTGVSGVEVGQAIADSADPVAATEQLIFALTHDK